MCLTSYNILPYSYRAYLAGVLPGGGVQLHPVTPLSLKLAGSNFVQNYFGVRSIFCDKKNWDQIDNDVTMMSSLFSRVSKIAKTTYFKIAAPSSSY